MPTEKFQHQLANFLCVSLEGEVAGVKQMRFSLWQVALVGLCSSWNEKGIVLAPCRQQGWLPLSKVCLEGWIEGDVASVVEDEIQLDFIGPRPRQVGDVER